MTKADPETVPGPEQFGFVTETMVYVPAILVFKMNGEGPV
jgi:hypothetical protein